ncbi:MAG TPA: prolyl oligopeptidase family serine peptidase [Sphingobium sp.]|uniref:prolyl oligopeptidase family serine peptidase n=1 Tax=Sphingobium sp. TaxID=1912891 RepID=UPI002ED65A38
MDYRAVRRLLVPAALMTLSVPALAEPFAYPETRRDAVVETQFGVPVADPYRWLENDVRTDPQVRDWVTAENKVTEAYLDTLPGRDILSKRMKRLYDYARTGVPRKGGGRYFYTRNSGLQNQSPLYVREGLNGPERMLVDPNDLARDGATALAEWEVSKDGRYLLYAVQDGGTDWRILRILDVDSGRTLDDRLEWVKYSNLSWAQDGKGFYYSRFDPPAGGKFQATVENQRIWYHAVGTAQTQDVMVYATSRQPKLGHSGEVTDDGRWLLVTSNEGTDDRYSLTLIPLTGEDRTPHPLVKGLKNDWGFIGNLGDQLYFRTDLKAPRGRIVRLDAAQPKAKPVQVVAQDPDTLAAASMIGGRIVLAYLADAKTVARLVDRDGRLVGDVPLPGIGTAIGFSRRPADSESFFSFSSYTDPSVVYRYDVGTNKATVWSRPTLAFDPEAFQTDQIFYPSKDGTQIPLFLIRRKDVIASGKPAPTILYGYGGFNIAQTPGFSATRLAWLEQGGAVAIANLRGGGEYGKTWHDAGRLAHKQNVFDDFIAAAEYLNAHGIAGKGQIAIEGRSNGGLLVGAVTNQRPDLFAAALPAVGVMDMLRFDRFTAGRYWVDDYGYPEKEADFRNLLGYSPYHNIRDGVDYPAILVTTADTDDRVVPGHSFKYTAALQHAAIGDKPHLIRIETRAGHGSGKPIDKTIAEFADMYAFAARWTGLTIRDPDGK